MRVSSLVSPLLAALLLASCDDATGPDLTSPARRTLPIGTPPETQQVVLPLYPSGEMLPVPPYGLFDLHGAGGHVVAHVRHDTLDVLLQVAGAKRQDALTLFYRAEAEPWEAIVVEWQNGDTRRPFGPWRRHAALITDDVGGAYGRFLIPLRSLPATARHLSFWINRAVWLDYGSTTATFLVTRSMTLPPR